ncbi:hypothetical protein ACIRG5_26220 [Lentzea sp. NPDC102401]|uniref:hypothetical protein n=1 Tax=Lentzea sp. NPDC102401 TaxID=3364128 RepID=UPI0037F756B9
MVKEVGNGEPLPDDQIAGRENLYSRVPVAGNDHRLELQGQIAFGKAHITIPDAKTEREFATQVGVERWSREFVWFPFDLDPLEEVGHYLRMAVRITFLDPDFIALYLAPGNGSTDVPFDGQATPFGLGRPALRWELRPGEGAEFLRPQGHAVLCLMQRPKDVFEVDLHIEVDVTILRTLWGREERLAATTSPGRYRISFENGDFTRLPD